jgi:hypothetical protein
MGTSCLQETKLETINISSACAAANIKIYICLNSRAYFPMQTIIGNKV